jgi:hypothetical protein
MMNANAMAALTAVFGARAAGSIGAAAVLVVLIAHGLMPWLPVAGPASPAWYRAIYAVLRLAAGNYANAAPARPDA